MGILADWYWNEFEPQVARSTNRKTPPISGPKCPTFGDVLQLANYEMSPGKEPVHLFSYNNHAEGLAKVSSLQHLRDYFV